MGTYRYHYSKLCEAHKEIYRLLYNGMMGMDNNIPIPPCDQYVLNDVYNKVLWDNVEIFYTNGCQLEICGFINFGEGNLSFFVYENDKNMKENNTLK